jgi:rhodanese-related sulfurtransferase
MLKRLLNLPFTVASRAARHYQEREDARIREQYGTAHDPGQVAMAGSVVSGGAGLDAASVQVEASVVLGWINGRRRVEIVDVRDPTEPGPRVPGAVSMPMSTVGVRVSELSWEHPVVAVCSDGTRSLQAVRFFRERGMEDTFALVGGIAAWRAAGGAVERA